jgi:hypothetical protein
MPVVTTTLLNVVLGAQTTTQTSASTACALFQWLNVMVNCTVFVGGPANTQDSFPVLYVNLFRVEPDVAATKTPLGSFPVRATAPGAGSAVAKTFGVGAEFGADIGANFIIQIQLASGITSATYSYSVVGKGGS